MNYRGSVHKRNRDLMWAAKREIEEAHRQSKHEQAQIVNLDESKVLQLNKQRLRDKIQSGIMHKNQKVHSLKNFSTFVSDRVSKIERREQQLKESIARYET